MTDDELITRGNDVEQQLSRLLARAAAILEQATSAAEVLEARQVANIAYHAAKRAAHMSNAHDTVLAACRKIIGEALVIEARAQCRLADEYDAAQAPGEARTKGGDYTSKFPNEKLLIRP